MIALIKSSSEAVSIASPVFFHSSSPVRIKSFAGMPRLIMLVSSSFVGGVSKYSIMLGEISCSSNKVIV